MSDDHKKPDPDAGSSVPGDFGENASARGYVCDDHDTQDAASEDDAPSKDEHDAARPAS